LPDRPNEARWLLPQEQDWIDARLAAERAAKTRTEQLTIWQVLRQPAVLILTAGLFLTYSAGYAFMFWEPTMLQRFTQWSVSRVSWFGAVIYGAALLSLLFVGWSSDRAQERRWHFAVPQLAAAAALALWFVLPSSNVLLILVFSFVAAGTVAHLPAFWALPSTFLSNSAAAAAIGFINCVASIGGFFGPKVVGNLAQRTGSFSPAFLFMSGCCALAAVLVLLCPREIMSDRKALPRGE
jgi:sugar phosphate permease